jgi:hypothetical protein
MDGRLKLVAELSAMGFPEPYVQVRADCCAVLARRAQQLTSRRGGRAQMAVSHVDPSFPVPRTAPAPLPSPGQAIDALCRTRCRLRCTGWTSTRWSRF